MNASNSMVANISTVHTPATEGNKQQTKSRTQVLAGGQHRNKSGMIAIVWTSAIAGTHNKTSSSSEISEKIYKAEMPATAGTPSNHSDNSNNRGARNRREACMKVFNSRE